MRRRGRLSQDHQRLPIAFGDNILRLKERIRHAPAVPGVYRWLDRSGRIVYVGKAKNLKNRLKSYVTGSHKEERTSKRTMWDDMWDLECTVTNTELEALILEMHLIRTIKPPYNVALTRDRHYIYVRIGVQELFPSVTIVHKRGLDSAQYFGPFTNPYGQERMLELLRSIFPFRMCKMGIRMKDPVLFFDDSSVEVVSDQRSVVSTDHYSLTTDHSIRLDVVTSKSDRRTPCFDHHIKRCSAPCDGLIDAESYRRDCIDGVLEFYNGQFGSVVDRLIGRMQLAQGERKFERAADILRALRFIQNLQQQHLMLGMTSTTMDAIGIVCKKRTAFVSLLQVRAGNIVNEVSVKMKAVEGEEMHALQQFLVEYYSEVSGIPDQILLPAQLPEHQTVKRWLSEKRADAVICCPKKGQQKKLLLLARANAERKLEAEAIKRSVIIKMALQAEEELVAVS